jgi:hypothetical protein
VLIGPSPCYINGKDYVGGFKRVDIEGLLEFVDSNDLGWSSTMAPAIIDNADRPELGTELTKKPRLETHGLWKTERTLHVLDSHGFDATSRASRKLLQDIAI